jgi:Leucine-rich repeat (LRR) protein
MGKLTNLKLLCLAGNDLEGRLPASTAYLTSLEQIWLSNNKFTGKLPDNLLDDWRAIRLLDFSSNQFRGRLPSIRGSRNPQLVNLFLEGNSFTGSLPETKGLDLLQVIDVGYNQVSGNIPLSWTTLPKLRDFNVAGNRMTGTIPAEILQLTNLEILILVSVTNCLVRAMLTCISSNLPFVLDLERKRFLRNNSPGRENCGR